MTLVFLAFIVKWMHMKIGSIETKTNIFLAPMAGVSDVGFRKLCSHFGAGLTYTEMASVKGFFYKSKKTEQLLTTFKGEHPVAVQLFGGDPKLFEEVCKSSLIKDFDIIDINMGCPAPKIVKNKEGSYLLKDFDRASQIIKTCVASTDKPVTVKFRIGYNEGENVAVEFAKMCQESGASAICVHGRTRSQFYSGKVDLETIKKVKDSVNIPVIGNGDVVDKASYEEMLKTGVDAVMVGRGACGKPEIFAELLDKKIDLTKLEIALSHFAILKEHKRLLPEFKKHLIWYVSGLKNCNDFKQKLVKADYSEIENLLKEFFNTKL